MQLQSETLAAINKVPKNTVADHNMRTALLHAEPLLVGLDCMLRYAKAYKGRFEMGLSEDYVLGPAWLETVKGLRALLNGDGAVAYELGGSLDSKDNGVCEEVFWAAMNAAGFTEKDL